MAFSYTFADFGSQGNWEPGGWDWEGKRGRGREEEAERQIHLKQSTETFSLLHLNDNRIFGLQILVSFRGFTSLTNFIVQS